LNQPLDGIDPSGLKCTYWYYMADYYHLDEICRRDWVNPEFDKCDRVGPVCCWIKDGKKVCREYYEDDYTKDPIIPSWPDRDNCPLEKEDAYKYLLKLITETIPRNMQGQGCRGRNKCDCGDKFNANIVCDKDMFDYFGEMVRRSMLPHNPCGRRYTWDCTRSTWDDKNGKPIPGNPNVNGGDGNGERQ